MKLTAALGLERAYAHLDAPNADFDKYFSRMRGGTLLKTTRSGRFADLDKTLLAELSMRFALERTIRVHDVAASSAITSAELYDTLRARGPTSVRASDYYDALFVVDHWMGKFVFDAEFQPLQVAIGGVGLSARKGPLRHVVRSFLESAMARRREARQVPLVHPAALSLASNDPNFTLVRESFFDPAPGPYEVVRLLNAIWPELGPEQCGAVLRAALATLTDDGVLVLGRAGNYTLFGRGQSGMAELAGFGDAGENRALVGGVAKLLN